MFDKWEVSAFPYSAPAAAVGRQTVRRQRHEREHIAHKHAGTEQDRRKEQRRREERKEVAAPKECYERYEESDEDPYVDRGCEEDVQGRELLLNVICRDLLKHIFDGRQPALTCRYAQLGIFLEVGQQVLVFSVDGRMRSVERIPGSERERSPYINIVRRVLGADTEPCANHVPHVDPVRGVKPPVVLGGVRTGLLFCGYRSHGRACEAPCLLRKR